MIGTARQIIMALVDIQDNDKEFEIKEHRRHRTLSQNSYYWTLATQIAHKLNVSTAEVHNRLLEDYGQREIIEGHAVLTPLPDTEETQKKVYRMQTLHLKKTSQVSTGNDGVTYRTYVLMRGSHSYNTVEMTQLLNGCIQEAKNMGIETLTPMQLEQMRRDAEEAEARQKARKKHDSARAV